MKCGMLGGAASIRDLLVIVTSFSLLSLFLTYQLGFPASRLRLGTEDEMRDIPDISVSVTTFPAEQLRYILQKLEEDQFERLREDRKVAKVQGQLSSVRRDLPFYTRALHKAGFMIRSKISIFPRNGNGSRLIEIQGSKDWSLLLCLLPLEGDENYCFASLDSNSLDPSQKISQFPHLRSLLWNRRGLCRIKSSVASSIAPEHILPSCFALPDNFEEFLTAADGPRFNKSWVLKSSNGRPMHLTTMEFFNRVRRKEFSGNFEGVIEEHIPNQLRVLGYLVSMQYYVLVTSMTPLRAYIYNEGLVNFREDQEKGYRKIPGKTWLLSQLWRHLAKASPTPSSAVRSALERTDRLIVQLLLATDAAFYDRTTTDTNLPPSARSGSENLFQSRCRYCFQLLTFDLMYNSSLHPEVMDVDGLPSMQDAAGEWMGSGGNGGWSVGSGYRATAALRQAVLQEMLSIVFASDVVHEDVLEALQSTAEELNTGISGVNCIPSGAICLTIEDLKSILETRREAIHLNDFRRLYPTSNGDHYIKLIKQLHTIPDNDIASEEGSRTAWELHILWSRLEALFGAQEVPEYEYSYLTETKLNHASFNLQSVKIGGSSKPNADITGGIQQSGVKCTSDESTYLGELEIEPSEVRLDPPFTAFWTEYSAIVPYSMTMIHLKASSMKCSLLVRIEDRIAATISVNTTLGVGLNRIPVYLVDSIGSVVTTYTLLIRRKGSSENALTFNPSQKHSVCSLRQECDFRISPTEPCGLQEEEIGLAWKANLRRINELPPCSHGDAPGRWIVPCTSCDMETSCMWKMARWQPYSCTHHHVSKEELDRCLDGKKLLFLGDSTNRGMMHYIMERLNGSLAACDKTHYIRVYGNLNRGRTAFSFAYYPQFWLPPSERPVFDKALYQLLLKSQPLQNTSSTVVIVGGVHWLATQHLHALIRAMRREGLQGASLFIKTLGSGFHIPAEGVHYLSKAQQEKLLIHSMGLAEFAHHHRMEVVDTFNITAARYKDFLQGKCACHFHKIVEIPVNPEEKWSKPTRYQVEGPINAIYTEILLSRLCKGHGKEQT